MIPKIFHWIWLGAKPPPDPVLVNTWRRLHPDWECRFWTNDTLPPLEHAAIFNSCNCIGAMSDLARIEVLSRHGGLYLDYDFECLKPIDHLLDRPVLLGMESDCVVGNGLIGAETDSLFIQHLLDMIPTVYAEHRETRHCVAYSTSIALINKCRADWPFEIKAERKEILFARPGEAAPTSISIHHTTRTWHYYRPGHKLSMFQP